MSHCKHCKQDYSSNFTCNEGPVTYPDGIELCRFHKALPSVLEALYELLNWSTTHTEVPPRLCQKAKAAIEETAVNI